MQAWHLVTVGVADMAAAEALWQDTFGLEVVSERAPGDAALAQLLGVRPEAVGTQRLLGTPGQSAGRLHLVEFPEPDPPVREGANAFDLAPKNLDIYVDDLPARERALRAEGWAFHGERYGEVTAPDGTRFR